MSSKTQTKKKTSYYQKKAKKPNTAMIAFIAAFVVLIGALVTVNVINNNNINEVYGIAESKLNASTREILDDPNYQNIILPEELNSKIENKEDFFVYFFASDCPHCRATTPKLMPIADELGIDLPQFNLREFDSGWRDYNIEYTPTLVYFEDGVQKERLVGGIQEDGANTGYTTDEIKAFFTKYKGDAAK